MGLRPEHFQVIARTLASEHGISVTLEGNTCHTEGMKITLPSIPPDIESDADLLWMMRYHLDSEVGKIIHKTDDKVIRAAGESGGDPGASLASMLETTRVSSYMNDKWAGCGVNQRRGVNAIAGRIDDSHYDDFKSDDNFKSAAVMRCYAKNNDSDIRFASLLSDKINVYSDPLYNYMSKLSPNSWGSTEGIRPAYNDMADILGIPHLPDDLQDSPPPPEPAKTDQSGDDDGGDKGDGDGDGEGKGGSKDGSNGKEGDQESGDQSSAAGSGASSFGSNQSSIIDSKAKSEQGRHSENQGVDQSYEPLFETPESLVSKHGAIKSGGHIILPNSGLWDEDYLRSMGVEKQSVKQFYDGYRDSICYYDELKQKEREVMSRGGRRLGQLLMAKNKSGWAQHKRRGSVNPAMVAHLASGTSNRVMRSRVEHNAKDTACLMMVDSSGSMTRSHTLCAWSSALAFAKATKMAGHKCCVTPFGYWEDNSIPQLITNQLSQRIWLEHKKNTGRSLSRNEVDGEAVSYKGKRHSCLSDAAYDNALPADDVSRARYIFPVALDWNEPVSELDKRAAKTFMDSPCGTPIAEAIYYGANHLMKQNVKRRVLFLFTDGRPENKNRAMLSCKYSHNLGIHTVIVSNPRDPSCWCGPATGITASKLEEVGPKTIKALGDLLLSE